MCAQTTMSHKMKLSTSLCCGHVSLQPRSVRCLTLSKDVIDFFSCLKLQLLSDLLLEEATTSSWTAHLQHAKDMLHL